MARQPKLKDDRVRDRIVEDVLQQIASGELQPGDKLAPVRKLCDIYGVSQRIVDQAKTVLVERGVLENRPRSGSYIAANAAVWKPREPVSGKSIKGGRSPEPALSTFSGMFRYYFPQLSPCTLRVYICEALETNLQLWQVLIKDFCETRPNVDVEMLTCEDGHVADLIESQEIDVVMATPVVLNSIGAERFHDVTDFIERLAASDDLLDIVPRGSMFFRDFVGVPFSISLSYLFINQSIAEQVGCADFGPATADEFFAMLAELAPRLKELGVSPMVGPGLNECLFMSGALSLDRRGKLHLDINRAIRCLEAIGRPGVFDVRGPDLEAFLAGEAFCMTNNSFQVVNFSDHEPDFDWRVLPVPVNAGAKVPAIMMTLAIHAGARNRNEALHFIAYMLTKRSQAEFGRLPGNLPVLRSALERPPLVNSRNMPPGTREESLVRNTLTWSEQSRARFLAHGGVSGVLAQDLLSGRLTAREAVERVWLMAH